MPRSPRCEGLSRRHRFTSRGSFGTVLRGSRKLRGRFTVIHVTPAPWGRGRIGVALTRRLIPSSVERNLVKRLMRETFRRHPAKGSGLDCVVMLRERFKADQSAFVLAEVRSLLDQLVASGAR